MPTRPWELDVRKPVVECQTLVKHSWESKGIAHGQDRNGSRAEHVIDSLPVVRNGVPSWATFGRFLRSSADWQATVRTGVPTLSPVSGRQMRVGCRAQGAGLLTQTPVNPVLKFVVPNFHSVRITPCASR